METIKKIHQGWETWHNNKQLQAILPETNGKWLYQFIWNNHSASLIRVTNGFSLQWEIWVGGDENPVQFGSRNACLNYMYRKWLGLEIRD